MLAAAYLLGALLLLCLNGCGRQTPAGAVLSRRSIGGNASTAIAVRSRSAHRRLRIALIPETLQDPICGCAHVGALRAAREFGMIDVEMLAPAKADPMQQAAMLDTMTSRKVDGILTSCADPDIVRQAINRAAGAGIPVVTFDSDCPESRRIAYCGVDETRLGAAVAAEMIGLLHGKGRVIILSGVRRNRKMTQREAGARAALAALPGISILTTLYCDGDADKAADMVAGNTRSRRPDGWLLLGPWPMMGKGGLKVIRPGVTKVVAVDAPPQSWKWIAGKFVQVCLAQRRFQWGEQGVKLLREAIAGSPVRPINNAGFDVVTPATLPAYERRWAAMNR